MARVLLLVISHTVVAAAGFAAGIYILPIWIAPDSPSAQQVTASQADRLYEARFRRDLKGSDFLHWGEGVVYLGRDRISFLGKLAPGPDYKLYLSPAYVETEEQFKRIKPDMVRVGDIRTFDNFIVSVPGDISPDQYTTVVIWCESFERLITSARYRK